MRVNWLGDQAYNRLKAKLFGNVDHAGAQYEKALETRISIVGPPRSRPLEAPHQDTGDYYDSWMHETDGVDDIIVSRVSTDIEYAVDLEFGTAHMAMRPHIRVTLVGMTDDLARTMCRQ